MVATCIDDVISCDINQQCFMFSIVGFSIRFSDSFRFRFRLRSANGTRLIQLRSNAETGSVCNSNNCSWLAVECISLLFHTEIQQYWHIVYRNFDEFHWSDMHRHLRAVTGSLQGRRPVDQVTCIDVESTIRNEPTRKTYARQDPIGYRPLGDR